MPTKNKKTTRKTVKKTEEIPQQLVSEEISTPKKNKSFPLNLKKIQILVILSLILLVGLLYYFKSLFIAATVNGEPISRVTVVKDLEKQGGKQTLDSLVTKALILQEAQKKNVTVNQSDIDAELKKINDSLSQRGQNLDQALAIQGMSKQDLMDQIKYQKLIEKMLGKEITVSDKEIDDYINSNKDNLPQDQNPEQIKTTVKQQLEQQKLGSKFQSWLADLKKNAKINYYVNY